MLLAYSKLCLRTRDRARSAVHTHLIVVRAHEVLNDVAARGIAARVAEPFAGLNAPHDARRVVDATETTRPLRSLHICNPYVHRQGVDFAKNRVQCFRPVATCEVCKVATLFKLWASWVLDLLDQ